MASMYRVEIIQLSWHFHPSIFDSSGVRKNPEFLLRLNIFLRRFDERDVYKSKASFLDHPAHKSIITGYIPIRQSHLLLYMTAADLGHERTWRLNWKDAYSPHGCTCKNTDQLLYVTIPWSDTAGTQL